MSRRLALAVLVAAAAAGAGACKHDGPARVEVVPGKRAGVVLEVSGTVTATRPGAPARTLAKGDEVSGDDELVTGADGSVLIELDHNHVTFTLPAGRTQRVAASLAWNQPAAATAKATTDEHSAAAGRAIERSAVDTAASSTAPGATGAAPMPSTQPVPPAAQIPTPPAADPSPARNDTEALDERKPEVEPAKPVRTGDMSKDVPSDPAMGGKSGGEGGGGTESATLDAPKPPSKGSTRAPVATSMAAPAFAITVAGGLTQAEAAAAIPAADVTGCWTTASATAVTVTIAVTAQGKVGRVTSSDAAATRCLQAALAKIAFPAHKTATTITLTVGHE